MARINLLTIHYGKCYGAVMQTYATCRLLEECGHTVTVINLISPKQKGNWKSLRYWKDCIREFQFWVFKKKYFSKLTNKGYCIGDIRLPGADITVVGSDQVWNRDITGQFGMTYFLDFVPNSQKKLSLSSSFGKDIWDEDSLYTSEVKTLLHDFQVLSIREESGESILKDVFGCNSEHLLDPTLAYSNFEGLILNRKEVNHIYPFLLLNNNDAQQKLELMSKVLVMPIFRHTRTTSRFANGPRHWLTRIYNAKYVITDSFHGLALSIIFKKQFFVFCADERKFTRLYSLLKLLGLESRYIKDISDIHLRQQSLIVDIDYSSVIDKLNNEIKKFKNFIKENL